MAEITEDRNSPQLKGGNGSGGVRNYTITGTTDETAAYQLVLDTAPPQLLFGSYVTLRQNIDVRPEDLDDTSGRGIWKATVAYEPPEKIKQPGTPVVNWDTSGETRHIAFSIKTRSKCATAGETPKDFEGAIGVQSQGGELTVQGCDVPCAKFTWSETWTAPAAHITDTYKQSVSELTGKTNGGPWRGYDTDEVLFYGATGSAKDGQAEITFKFAAGKNEVNIPIPEVGTVMTLPEKRAWDYLWVHFRDKTSDNQLIRTPVYAYAEQVVKQGDFGVLEIGSQSSGSGSASASTSI